MGTLISDGPIILERNESGLRAKSISRIRQQRNWVEKHYLKIFLDLFFWPCKSEMNQSYSFSVDFWNSMCLDFLNNNLQGRFNELQPKYILEGTNLSVAKSAKPSERGEDGGFEEGGGGEEGGG